MIIHLLLVEVESLWRWTLDEITSHDEQSEQERGRSKEEEI